MKKFLLVMGMIIALGCSFSACSDDNSVTELLPMAQVVLKDGTSILDSIQMSAVVATKNDNMLVITGTDNLSDGKKLIIYLDGNEEATHSVHIDAASLLSFNIGSKTTVIYYVSKEEYYLLVDGEITLTNTNKMVSGSFHGTVIPAHNLTNNPSLETILTWYNSSTTIQGDYRTYSIKF